MAVDTAQKRMSAMLLYCPWRPNNLPLPDGLISTLDRVQLAYLYVAPFISTAGMSITPGMSQGMDIYPTSGTQSGVMNITTISGTLVGVMTIIPETKGGG